MRLQAIRRVEEGCGVRDLAGDKTAGEVVDTVRHGVPYTLLLILRGVWRRRDLVAFYNERIQVDHGEMIVEKLDYMLSGYV